jgi:hypothetical protein
MLAFLSQSIQVNDCLRVTQERFELQKNAEKQLVQVPL